MTRQRTELWLQKLQRMSSWRIWLAVHIAALMLQWMTIRSAPIVTQHSNGQGWWALCLTAKGP